MRVINDENYVTIIIIQEGEKIKCKKKKKKAEFIENTVNQN